MLRLVTFLSAALLALMVQGPVFAQDIAKYPDHPVRVIVGYAAGSGPDIHARTVAAQLSNDLGQNFYVENRLGANGTLATRAVVQAAPDGYTILFTSNGIAPTPYIYKSLGFDIFTDLKVISTQGILDGLFILVDAKSDVKTLQQLIDKAKKGRVLYGSPGVGNGLHLATELFSKSAGIKMEHVPYKGASEVMNGMLGGSVDVMFVTPPSVIGLIRGGTVRPLGFTGTKPFPAFPEVPLVKDIVPGFEPIGSWGVFMAPGKTPDALVDRLNKAIQTALKNPKVSEVMVRDGYLPDGRTPKETEAFFRKEVEATAAAVKAAGIEAN
jgi:tripartite-type tricarboxylate transporter receptor subunit TctC